jgi:hypothetical protein
MVADMNSTGNQVMRKIPHSSMASCKSQTFALLKIKTFNNFAPVSSAGFELFDKDN